MGQCWSTLQEKSRGRPWRGLGAEGCEEANRHRKLTRSPLKRHTLEAQSACHFGRPLHHLGQDSAARAATSRIRYLDTRRR